MKLNTKMFVHNQFKAKSKTLLYRRTKQENPLIKFYSVCKK